MDPRKLEVLPRNWWQSVDFWLPRIVIFAGVVGILKQEVAENERKAD